MHLADQAPLDGTGAQSSTNSALGCSAGRSSGSATMLRRPRWAGMSKVVRIARPKRQPSGGACSSSITTTSRSRVPDVAVASSSSPIDEAQKRRANTCRSRRCGDTGKARWRCCLWACFRRRLSAESEGRKPSWARRPVTRRTSLRVEETHGNPWTQTKGLKPKANTAQQLMTVWILWIAMDGRGLKWWASPGAV